MHMPSQHMARHTAQSQGTVHMAHCTERTSQCKSHIQYTLHSAHRPWHRPNTQCTPIGTWHHGTGHSAHTQSHVTRAHDTYHVYYGRPYIHITHGTVHTTRCEWHVNKHIPPGTCPWPTTHNTGHMVPGTVRIANARDTVHICFTSQPKAHGTLPGGTWHSAHGTCT